MPFFRRSVGTGDRGKVVCTRLPQQRGRGGQEEAALDAVAAAWRIVYGYAKLVLLLIPTLWIVGGYAKLILLQIPKS